MSLVDQSQQWFPTSVQVTVHQARNLRFKGKNGTNDAFAIIQVAKDKFSTCVAEKSVDPVWKEEASFDLPLFHPGNAERCTLYITVMHQAKGGFDKFLGQAVINLVDLHENKTRKKTDWFKLVEKSGKEDKERGEVLLDITFMRNNMSASMFDLSMQDKPRSRISKLKDKVRGKKKDSFSDSASAIVPSVSQVLTDSEGEADAQSLNQSSGVKKKSKLKTLFAPKSNLHRNVSQSMSTLGTLPEKNSSLSGSRSSGLNIDSPEAKTKFKIFGHKRTGSSDSRVSQGPFSLLGRSKQSNSDQNNLCINGSHVYAEDAETKSGSTVSLNSAGSGEDRHTFDISTGPFGNVPDHTHRPEPTDRAIMEQHRHQEEEARRQAEESRVAEAKRMEEEERHKVQLRRLQEEEERRQQEEQEGRKKFLEDEARRQKQREEEEVRRKEEECREAESRKLEEEQRKVEEQKKQDEASMSDRLSTLFGIIRKKEDKKEEVQQHQLNQKVPAPTPFHELGSPEPQASHHSTNPFEDIPLSSDNPLSSTESPSDHQKSSPNASIPSAMVFLNRTAKVSAVKPRLAQSPEPEPPDLQIPSEPSPSPATPESTLSSLSSVSPDLFANLHSLLAPPNLSQSRSGSPRESIENLSLVESDESSVMADKKRKAPLPPVYPAPGNQTAGNGISVEADGSQGKKTSIPLPDYETLFPQKRHGVQGHTRWDHIIAEVNQKHRDSGPVLLGPEMSVDGPQERQPSPRSSISPDSLLSKHYPSQPLETKHVASKKGSTHLPIPTTTPRHQSPAASTQRQSQDNSQQSVMRPSYFAEQGSLNTGILDADGFSGLSRNGERKALQPPTAATQVSVNKEVPTARPRQVTRKESDKREESPLILDKNLNGSTQNFPGSVRNVGTRTENFGDFHSLDFQSKDPWGQPKQNQVNDPFSDNSSKEKRPETQGMTADDLDQIFGQEKPADPFAGFNGSDSNTQREQKSADDSMPMSFHVFQRSNSQRKKQTLASNTQSDNKGLPQNEQPTKTGATQAAATRDLMKEPTMLQPQADDQTQSSYYRGDAHFAGEDFFLSSAPLQVIMEEPTGSLSGGKTPLQAWVSPSEVQPTSVYKSTGGGLDLTPRRPHPVKPLTSVESQFANSSHSVKDIRIQGNAPGKIKVSDSGENGPFSQLTQEELITLVVKQQTDLSRKDAKIMELEEYIDKLLLRVIEEKPSILQALNSVKPV